MDFVYTEQQVRDVSDFLQLYMKKNNIPFLTADECAQALADASILTNTKGPKMGFNFREMLRQCRDGVFNNQVSGAYQRKPGARWKISYVG
ncbi:hypothetical protein [Sphingobacterium sp. R2]|uniref:hypothetical protein n=1 Tax=Sphingobacterium sp. R2 TaxID=3112958 RepID=UPI00345D3AD0